MAQENYIRDGNNRIILDTDGDFNVGSSSNAEMERLIEGIERHWLVRKYIEQRQPNTRIPSSEVVP